MYPPNSQPSFGERMVATTPAGTSLPAMPKPKLSKLGRVPTGVPMVGAHTRKKVAAQIKSTYDPALPVNEFGLPAAQVAAEREIARDRDVSWVRPVTVMDAKRVEQITGKPTPAPAAYNRNLGAIYTNPETVPALGREYGMGIDGIMNHELAHHIQAYDRDRFANFDQQFNDKRKAITETAPRIGDIAFMGERERQAGNKAAADIQVDLSGSGVRQHSLGWMADQARQHEYFSGGQMDSLLASGAGQQFLKMHARETTRQPVAQPRSVPPAAQPSPALPTAPQATIPSLAVTSPQPDRSVPMQSQIPPQPSFGQRMLGMIAAPSRVNTRRPVQGNRRGSPQPGPGMAGTPMAGTPMAGAPMAGTPMAQSQSAMAANALTATLQANPIEAEIAANPMRQAAMAQDQAGALGDAGIAAMQGIQSRLAEGGNAQLGFGGRFSATDLADIPSSPFGRSEMPGVVTRGGVTNVVGQPTQIPMGLDDTDSRLIEREFRRNETATRVDENRIAQVAANQSRARELGLDGGGSFVGGARYGVEGQEGRAPMSNLAVARSRMTPEQNFSFDQRKTARDADMALSKQRQFARAQFREATAGRGAMTDPDGGLDMTGTMAAQAFGRNPAMGIGASLQDRKISIDDMVAQAALTETERRGTLDQQRFSVEKMVADDQIAQNKFMREGGQLPSTVREMMTDRRDFGLLSPEAQQGYFYDAESLATANPADKTGAEVVSSVPDQWLIQELRTTRENPNYFSGLDAEQSSEKARRGTIIKREMAKRGMQIPIEPEPQDSFLNKYFGGMGGISTVPGY